MTADSASTEARDWRNFPFRLAEFDVDPRRNRITGPAGEAALQPKVIDVLCALAERSGEVLSRTELIDRVWGKEFGADESLTRAISQLRRAFGDTRDVPRIIETIPKRGYRLMIAPIERSPGNGNATAPVHFRKRFRPLWIGAIALFIAMSAIASFVAFRPAPLDETAGKHSERTEIVVTVEPFRADDPSLPIKGLADELSTSIARSPLIRVRTAGSPEPAGDFAYRLRGEVLRASERLRINIQLLDAGTGEVVWGESYEPRSDAQFPAQDSIVRAVTRESFPPLLRAVKQKLLHRPVFSLEPWELILLVTWVPGDERMWTGPPTEDSYWLQRRALELDPDFAPAHALFAELASYHALYNPPSNSAKALARARQHAERAIELTPYDPEVLYQLALYYRSVGNRARALAALDRVLELQPDRPLARIDREFTAGQCGPDSATAIARLKAEIDTLSPSNPERWVALSHLASLHLARGEFKRAREAALASRRINPASATAMTLAAADIELGLEDEARAVLSAHMREWPNLDLHYFADRIVPRWCLGGPLTGRTQQTFRRLANVVQPAHK